MSFQVQVDDKFNLMEDIYFLLFCPYQNEALHFDEGLDLIYSIYLYDLCFLYIFLQFNNNNTTQLWIVNLK